MPRKTTDIFSYKPSRTKWDRNYVYRFTNGRCYYCKKELTRAVDWHVEHLTPLSKDGEDRYINIAPACAECNRLKGTRTVEEFKKFVLEVVYWKLDQALDATEILERFGAPKEELEALRNSIKEAMDVDLDLEVEMKPNLFPGESVVKAFHELMWERLCKRTGT